MSFNNIFFNKSYNYIASYIQMIGKFFKNLEKNNQKISKELV